MSAPNRRSLRFGLAVLCLGAAPLAATTYLITVTDDTVSNNGNCTLREAIRAADTDLAVDACPAGDGDDVITLDSVTVTFDGGSETIYGSNGALTIQGATTNKADAWITCGLWDNRFLFLSSADLTLQNLSVSYCDAGSEVGGVVYASSSDLTVRNVSMTLNKADWYGGAIYFFSSGNYSQLLIEDSEIGVNGLGNGPAGQDPWGAGVSVQVSYRENVVIRRTTFGANSLNSATKASEGGGLRISASGEATVTLRDLVFSENTCADAATKNHRGCGFALYLSGTASAELAGIQIIENSAGAADAYSRVTGAALQLSDDATLVAERLFLLDNLGVGSASTDEVQLSVIAKDSSSALVRDVVVAGGQTGLRGELVDSTSASLRFDHFTVTENEEGVVLDASGTGGSVTFQNSIVWNNSIYAIDDNGVASLPSNNLGGTNPYFYDPVNDDFRLTVLSPDRNTGDETLPGVGFCDLDHAPRVAGAHTDKGAYELGGIFADDFEGGDTSAW